jgi:hypothetical protein
MKYKSIILISIFSILISACGSSMPKMPKWYLNTPTKKGYLYATGSELSNKMQTAVNEARDVAFNDLAQQIDAETNRDADRAQQEIGDEVLVNQFTDKSRSILSKQLQNVKVIERSVVKEKKNFRAYILIEYDLGAAQKVLMAELEADKELYQALKATNLLKDMETNLEAYRQRRK